MRKSNRINLPDLIERVHPSTLRPPENPVHKDNVVVQQKIAHSIEELDFVDPLLVGPKNEIIDGVRRWKAALKQEVSHIPIIRIEDATPAQVKAIRLALNKTQEGGRWDDTALTQGIKELIGQGFDVLKLGFDAAEIDKLLSVENVLADDPLSTLPDSEDSVTDVGDIFQLGEHLVACNDCQDATLVATIMGNEQAAACIMDPPYNVRVSGHVSGKGKNKHAEFAMASGEMTPPEYLSFLGSVVGAANQVIKPGGYQYIFIDWAHAHQLVEAGLANGLDHINICVWVKSNASWGGLYRSQHEMICVFRKPGAKGTDNVKLGRYGRNRSNVWDFRGANAFGRTRDEDLKDHPTVKPVSLIEDALKDCTKRGEFVLDLFGGSGTTMLAAERCGRKARLVEIEPKYVDVTVRRMQQTFDIEAVHLETGLPFAALRERRRAKAQS